MTCDNLNGFNSLSCDDAESRILNWTADYSLNNLFKGSLTASDVCCVDGQTQAECTELCHPIQVCIEGEVLNNAGIAAIDTCYNTDRCWLNGLQRSYTRSYAQGTTSVQIESYFEYLKSKSILSQQFNGDLLSYVLPIIYNYYLGVPLVAYDKVEIDDINIKGPFEGNSAWDELRQLAQAGLADLYEFPAGVINIERYKDCDSPIEQEIPLEMIISAERAEYKYPESSVFTVTGATISGISCPDEVISTDSNGNKGKATKCSISGLEVDCLVIDFNNLNATEKDIKAANIAFGEVEKTSTKKNLKDGGFSVRVCNRNGEPFGLNPTEINYLITAKVLPSSTDLAANSQYNNNQRVNGVQEIDNMFERLLANRFPVPYSNFGLGAFGSPSFVSGQRKDGANSSNITQNAVSVTAFRADPPECGISEESISNKYVYSKSRLFQIAKRRYQEILLAQNTWNVEVAYMPCLALNQVVTFHTIDTEDCPSEEITGIILGMNVAQTTDADGTVSHSMRLAIGDRSCLCQEELVSTNLMSSGFCDGTGETANSSGWLQANYDLDPNGGGSSSSSSGSSGDGDGGGYAFLAAYPAHGTAFINYQFLNELVIGQEYEYSFEWEVLQPTVPTPATAGTFITSGATVSTESFGGILLVGTLVNTFTAVSTNLLMEWQLNLPPVATYIKLTKISLRTKVLA